MAKLRYPTSPGNIAQLSHLEPMKLTIDGRPVTAIMVVNHLMVVEKDGSMVNYPVTGNAKIEFIDYLKEDESITIFGSSTGEAKDDPREAEITEQDLAPRAIFPAGAAKGDYAEAPLYVPFITRGRYGSKKACVICFTPSGRKIILTLNFGDSVDNPSFGGCGYDYVDRPNPNDGYMANTYSFVSLAPPHWLRNLYETETAKYSADRRNWPEEARA